MPFWTALMLNRPRDRWNDADLANAAALARAQCDVERLHREIAEEGDLIDGKVNPKHVILDKLVRRVMALSRLLHVHPEATEGRAEDSAKALANARAARTELGDDPLIPRLRAV